MAAADPLNELSKKALGVLLDGIGTWVFWRGFILALAVATYWAYELGYVAFWNVTAPIKQQEDEITEYEARITILEAIVEDLEKSVEDGHTKIVNVVAFFALAPSGSVAFDYDDKMVCHDGLSNVELDSGSMGATAMIQHADLKHYCNEAMKDYEDYKFILNSAVKNLKLERLEDLTRPSQADAMKQRFEVQPRTQGDRIPEPPNPGLKRLGVSITDI